MYALQQIVNILQLGSIYGLIALGYSMVYGVLAMINFAHGDLFMAGAFFCLIGSVWLKLPFGATLVFSMCAVAVLGVVIERLAYKPLRKAPRVSAIITALGVGVFLESLTLALCPYPQTIPELIPDRAFFLPGGVSVTLLQFIIISVSLALMAGLDFLVRKTKAGMAMRAISWNAGIVPLLGIPSELVISLTFALGAGLGGAAGMMYALAYPVIDPYIG
ncbi:MAG: branched-chain amino acid ABC transporter permease, partial [Elusimicrobiaceae bacterium]